MEFNQLGYKVKSVLSEECPILNSERRKKVLGAVCLDIFSGYGCPLLRECRKTVKQLKGLTDEPYDALLAQFRERQKTQAGLYRYGHGEGI